MQQSVEAEIQGKFPLPTSPVQRLWAYKHFYLWLPIVEELLEDEDVLVDGLLLPLLPPRLTLLPGRLLALITSRALLVLLEPEDFRE